MNLIAGWRIAVAPKFHLDADWPSRLAIGAGVEEADGHFFARGPWRPLTENERAMLVAAPAPVARSPGALPLLDEAAPPAPARVPDDAVCLFLLPAHLRDEWWKLVDASAETGGPVQGFDGFAANVSSFLAFKQLGASGALQMEALVTAPGARSIRVDPATGAPSGMGPTVAPWSPWPIVARAPVPRLHAVVNLDDEPTGVVFLPLALPDLATELARCAPTEPQPATVGDLVAQFLKARPDYPPVRLRVGPGEGCRLPTGGVILDGDMTGKEDPGVLLLISESGSVGADDPPVRGANEERTGN